MGTFSDKDESSAKTHYSKSICRCFCGCRGARDTDRLDTRGQENVLSLRQLDVET